MSHVRIFACDGQRDWAGDMTEKRADSRLRTTPEQAPSRKRTWQRPEVIRATLDQAEANVLAGPEIIINVSTPS
jgi:hypothetical protein